MPVRSFDVQSVRKVSAVPRTATVQHSGVLWDDVPPGQVDDVVLQPDRLSPCKHCKKFLTEHAGENCLFEPTRFEPSRHNHVLKGRLSDGSSSFVVLKVRLSDGSSSFVWAAS